MTSAARAIVNIPTAAELHETADGWLMLAWEQVVETSLEWEEIAVYIAETEQKPKAGFRKRFWNARRHLLNNSLLLCQQAMELDLKARIAAVDPLELVVGKQKERLRQNGGNFLEAKTISAGDLPAEVERICNVELGATYTNLFEKIRLARNRIAHLHGGNFSVHARERINDVLSVFKVIHPDTRWQAFWKANMDASGRLGSISDYDDDWTHSRWLRELEAAVRLVDAASVKRHFGFDKGKPVRFCPRCWAERPKRDTDERDFAQLRRDGTISCAGCMAIYPSEAAYEAESW